MTALQAMTLEQASDLIVSRLRTSVKYAEDPVPAVTAPTGTAPPTAAPSSISPLYAALITGGLGAGAGALGSLSSSDKEKRKRWLKHMLFGGAVGGIGGGALASLLKGTQGLIPQTNREEQPPVVDKGGDFWDKLYRIGGDWKKFVGLGGGDGKGGDAGGDGSAKDIGRGLVGGTANAAVNADASTLGLTLAGGGAGLENYWSRRVRNDFLNKAIQGALNHENAGAPTQAVPASPGSPYKPAVKPDLVTPAQPEVAATPPTDAIPSRTGSAIIDQVNKTLREKNLPEITHDQYMSMKTPQSRLGYAYSKYKQNVNDGAVGFGDQLKGFMNRTSPVNRPKPFGPPRPADLAPRPSAYANLWEPRASTSQKLQTHASFGNPAEVPKTRWGARGAGVGLAASTLLSFLGDANATAKEQHLQSSTPMSMQ